MRAEEAELVKEILERVDPMIHRRLNKLIEQHGINVGLSVVTNMATSFVALAVMIVERHGGNVDEFMSVLLSETREKYDLAHATDKTQKLLMKVMAVDPKSYTCSPPTKH